MPLEFKAAMSKLKSAPGKGLHFFFCEAGEDGKPLLIVDTKKIPKAAQAEALKKAKKKGKCSGKLDMSSEGELELTPFGAPPTSLARGVQVVARNANAMPKGIVVKDAVPDEEGDEEDHNSDVTDTGNAADDLTGQDSGMTQSYVDQSYVDQMKTNPSYVAESYEDNDTYSSVELPVETQRRATIDKDAIFRLKQSTSKKFPDVLRADPKLAQLLDLKAQAITQVAELQKAGSVSNEDLFKAIERLEKIDTALEQAQANLNRQGIAPQALGKEYKDEEKMRGWRAGNMAEPVRAESESDQDFAQRMQDYQEYLKFRASDEVTTKHFSEEEREQAKVSIDEKGRLRDADGDKLRHTSTEYVMDREGELHKFDSESIVGSDGKKKIVHHSSIMSGQEVTGAGGFSTDRDGKIDQISNLSGHYKPGRAQMIQTVEALLKKGALLDKEWTDAQGRPLQGQAEKVYQGAMKLQKKIMDKLEEDPEADLSSDLALVESAKKMLAKLGCGPSNKMSAATVAFLEIKEGMSGLQIKRAVDDVKRDAVPVEDFLRTGGVGKQEGEAVAEQGQQLRSELEERLKDKRKQLDDEANSRSERFAPQAGPSEGDVKDMAKRLKQRHHDFEAGSDEDDDELFGASSLEDALASSKMPKDFGRVKVVDPQSGYAEDANTLANRKGLTLEALWSDLKSEQGDSQDPLPDQYEDALVDDPEREGYRISVKELSKRLKRPFDEVYRQYYVD
jgi:hypothetical protein